MLSTRRKSSLRVIASPDLDFMIPLKVEIRYTKRVRAGDIFMKRKLGVAVPSYFTSVLRQGARERTKDLSYAIFLHSIQGGLIKTIFFRAQQFRGVSRGLLPVIRHDAH